MRRSSTVLARSRATRSPVLACSLVTWSLGCARPPATAAMPSCPDRAVVIASQADVARLAGCKALPGLVIRSGGALDVSRLHALVTITGDLVIGPTIAVEEVTLGELRVVSGAIRVVSNGRMQGLYLSRLERAGRITIDGNVAVTTISLPHLETVRGALAITDNASLELVDLPVLTAVDGELVLVHNPRLALLDAAQLRHAASVQLDAPRLPPETAARLRAVVNASPSEQ